jgi:hypothetical protein
VFKRSGQRLRPTWTWKGEAFFGRIEAVMLVNAGGLDEMVLKVEWLEESEPTTLSRRVPGARLLR